MFAGKSHMTVHAAGTCLPQTNTCHVKSVLMTTDQVIWGSGYGFPLT